MLSSKGNENNFARAAQFFVHFFAVVLHDYNVKLQKLPGYTFYEGSVVRVLVHFVFSLLLLFTPLTATKFDVVPPTKNVSLFFLSRSSSFSRWASLACYPTFLFFYVFLFLYIPNLWTWQNINLSLILYTTRIQKHFDLSIFVFIDSFVVLASQDAGGHIVCFPA